MQNIFVSNLLSVWSLAETTDLPESYSFKFRETCLAKTQRLGRLKVWECLGESVKLTNWSHVKIPRRAVWTNKGDSEVIHLLRTNSWSVIIETRAACYFIISCIVSAVQTWAQAFFFICRNTVKIPFIRWKLSCPATACCCTGSFSAYQRCVCVRACWALGYYKHPV